MSFQDILNFKKTNSYKTQVYPRVSSRAACESAADVSTIGEG